MTSSESQTMTGAAPAQGTTVRRWHAPDMSGMSAGSQPGVLSMPLTAERIGDIEAQAHEEGYRRGLEEGRAAGRLQMNDAAQRLEDLLESIDPLAGVLDEPLLEQLGELVLVIARQFVRRELSREPGEIVRVVREAMAALPMSEVRVHIHLHPEDVRLVREALPAETLERTIRLHDDLTLSRGGTRVETDVSLVDASVETRMTAIAARLLGDERVDGPEYVHGAQRDDDHGGD